MTKDARNPPLFAHKKQSDQHDESGETSVTWNHGVGQDGNQSFTGRVDNPAADNTGSVTAEAHSHEWSLMPVPVSFLLPAGSAF